MLLGFTLDPPDDPEDDNDEYFFANVDAKSGLVLLKVFNKLSLAMLPVEI